MGVRNPSLCDTIGGPQLTAASRLGEVTSGLVCCCLPCLPKGFRHLSVKIRTSLNGSSSKPTLGSQGKNIFAPSREPYLELEKPNPAKTYLKQPRIMLDEYEIDPEAQKDGLCKRDTIWRTITVEVTGKKP